MYRIKLTLMTAFALAISSAVAQANPIINIALLARPTGTLTAFSSTITNPTANTTYDYEVVYTLAGPGTSNIHLTTTIAGYRTSQATSLTTGDGLNSIYYCLQQAAGDASQTTFDYANGGNAAAYANYPDGLARPELAGPSGRYDATNHTTSGTTYQPAGPGPWLGSPTPGTSTVNYNATGTTAGTPTARGNGNMDMGNTQGTCGFSSITGGLTGISGTNTPVPNMIAGNGVFTITSVGSGATTSTVSPTWKGMNTGGNDLILRYLNASSVQVSQTFTVGTSQMNPTTGVNVADPIYGVTPLTIVTTGPSVTNGQYTLTAAVGATAIMKGDTTSVTSTFINSGSGTQASLDFTGLNSIATGAGTVNANSSGATNQPFGASATTTTQTLTGSAYGSAGLIPQISTVNNNANTPNTPPANTPANTTANVNVGVMVPGTTGAGTNPQLVQFNGQVITSSTLPSATGYGSGSQTAKYGTHTDGTGANAVPGGFNNATQAELLDGAAGTYTAGDNTGGGSHAPGARVIRMTWRTRADNEMPGAPPTVAGAPNGVYTDVVQLSGLDGSVGAPAPTAHVHSDKFVLQMTVSDAAFGGSHAAMQAAISNGFMYLGWLNDTTGTPSWTNAVDGNFANETGIADPSAAKPYVGSYANYYAGATGISGDAKGNNSFRIGDWGLQDLGPGNGAVVWAVMDHNSIFAAVPEPSSIVMLGFGLVGLVTIVRRRRTAVNSIS